MVSLIITLYGKPCWDMELEKEEIDDCRMFKKQGNKLRNRLYKVSWIVDTLLELGWKGIGGTYEIIFYKDVDIEVAKKELGFIDPLWNFIYIDWKGYTISFSSNTTKSPIATTAENGTSNSPVFALSRLNPSQ